MRSQNNAPSRLESITCAVIAGLAMITVVGTLDWTANHAGNLLWHIAGAGLNILPSLALSLAQTVQNHTAGQCWIVQCFPRLLSCLPSLLAVAGVM